MNSEDPDQPVQMHRLIWVLTGQAFHKAFLLLQPVLTASAQQASN